MKPLARTDEILAEDMVRSCIIYDTRSKKAHSLNPIGTWIWRHCDGSTTVEEMTELFDAEFQTNNSTDLILSGLQQLSDANLLASAMEDQTISRRAVIAAGSALTPVLASITVPRAAAAKSKPDKARKPNKNS